VITRLDRPASIKVGKVLWCCGAVVLWTCVELGLAPAL